VGLREQQAATRATTNDPQPTPAPTQQEGASARPACPGIPWSVPWGVPACPGVPWKPEPASGPVEEAPPDPTPSQAAFAHRVPLADGLPPYVPQFTSVPDTRVPFSIKVNPFKHRR
jgi:hypothetical protein